MNQISFRTRVEEFKNSFFPCCISEWNKLSNLTKQSENIKQFKNALMKDIKSNERSLFSIYDRQSVRLLSWLKFTLVTWTSPMCNCWLEIESTQHFFLRYYFYHVENRNFLIASTTLVVNELNEDSMINLVLFGSDKYYKEANRKVLFDCITYLKATKRFDEPLLWLLTPVFFSSVLSISMYISISLSIHR